MRFHPRSTIDLSAALRRGALVPAAISILAAAGCDRIAESPAAPECFTVHDPYAHAGRWHCGNFHMHSSHSDGTLDGQHLVELYERNGYTVLCIADHNQYGDQDGGVLPAYQVDDQLHDWNGDGALHPEHVFGRGVEAYVHDWTQPPAIWARNNWYRPAELDWWTMPVVIAGAEMTARAWHIGVVGLPSGPVEPPDAGRGYIERARDAGGFLFLAHPGEWNASPGRLARELDLGDFDGIEIMNGLRMVQPKPSLDAPSPDELLRDPPPDCSANYPPDATPLWDALLTRGYRLWGLANDDSHTWVGAAEAYPFTAFDMVLAGDPTVEGFLQALHAGSFYASTGLFFRELGVRGDSVVAWAPAAKRLRFIGSGGTVLLESNAPRAGYVVTGGERYVRVEAQGDPDEAHSWPQQAWSQPFFIEPAPCASGAPRGGSGG